MIRPLRHIEIIKQAPAMSGTEALVLGAVTSSDDIVLHDSLYPAKQPGIWLVLGTSNILRDADGDSANNFAKEERNRGYIVDLSRQMALYQLPYSDTVFACYRQSLSTLRTVFPALNKRTVWIPATGFFAETWQDGPLVVTEADGLISSFIPTGTAASLVLAPDGTKAIGREPIQALAIEGNAAQRLLRGCIAAARHTLAMFPVDQICLKIFDQSVGTMVQLAIIRAALPGKTQMFVTLANHEQQRIEFKTYEPKFRRFCEHTGISSQAWIAENAGLPSVCHFVLPEWTDQLLEAVNAHGALVPL